MINNNVVLSSGSKFATAYFILISVAGCGTSVEQQSAGVVASYLDRIYAEDVYGEPFKGKNLISSEDCSEDDFLLLYDKKITFEDLYKKCRVSNVFILGRKIIITSNSGIKLCEEILKSAILEYIFNTEESDFYRNQLKSKIRNSNPKINCSKVGIEIIINNL